jgi:hypothetical protein
MVLLASAIRWPDELWFLNFIPMLALIPVVNTVHKINLRYEADESRNEKFSAINLIGIVVGVAAWILALSGMYLPGLRDAR